MRKTKKGYILPIAIIAAFLLTAAAITALTVVYRYVNATRGRVQALREQVFDDPALSSSSDGLEGGENPDEDSEGNSDEDSEGNSGENSDEDSGENSDDGSDDGK